MRINFGGRGAGVYILSQFLISFRNSRILFNMCFHDFGNECDGDDCDEGCDDYYYNANSQVRESNLILELALPWYW